MRIQPSRSGRVFRRADGSWQMDAEQRRERLMELLRREAQPVSGMKLAERLGVSRQVIVQDIALLRAVNKNILSTNKGYLLFHEEAGKGERRTVKVKHDDDRILEELYTIVDNGGRVLDVVVEHAVYGQITVDLIINSRRDADGFMEQIRRGGTKPLKELTQGVHYHTIEAQTRESLELIEKRLAEKGFLERE